MMLNVLLEKREEPKVEVKPAKERYDWRYENSISNGKKVEIDGDYSQWRINNILANYDGLTLIVNEMNIHYDLTDKMHYDYLYGAVRKQKRWAKTETKEEKKQRDKEQELQNLISNYYKYNIVRTKEALKILTAEQIDIIRNKNNKGGVK